MPTLMELAARYQYMTDTSPNGRTVVKFRFSPHDEWSVWRSYRTAAEAGAEVDRLRKLKRPPNRL